MSIDYEDLKTAQDWVDAGHEIVTAARDAAKGTDKAKWQSAADECAEFVNERTLDCPKDLVHIVAAVQAELSQLIVAEAIGSVKSRTAQFEAYLLDVDALSAGAEKAAGMISLKAATDAVADVTGVVNGLKAVKKALGKSDVDIDAVVGSIEDLIARLDKVQQDVKGLGDA